MTPATGANVAPIFVNVYNVRVYKNEPFFQEITIQLGVIMRLYLYSNLAGIQAWAASPEEFRSDNGLKGGYAVRIVNKSHDIPSGFVRTGRGLANDPIVGEGATLSLARRTAHKNLYGLGVAILASYIDMGD